LGELSAKPTERVFEVIGKSEKGISNVVLLSENNFKEVSVGAWFPRPFHSNKFKNASLV